MHEEPGAKPRKGKAGRYDKESAAWQQEMRRHLHNYKHDLDDQGRPRHFTQRDVYAPAYSQAHEDGYFSNPPTDQAYRQGAPDPSGFDRVKSYLKGKLQGMTKNESALDAFIRPSNAARPAPWGMGALEPTHTAAQAIEPLVRGAWANMNEPKEFDPTGGFGGVSKLPAKLLERRAASRLPDPLQTVPEEAYYAEHPIQSNTGPLPQVRTDVPDAFGSTANRRAYNEKAKRFNFGRKFTPEEK